MRRPPICTTGSSPHRYRTVDTAQVQILPSCTRRGNLSWIKQIVSGFALTGLSLSLMASGKAEAISFTFEKVVDNSGSFSGFNYAGHPINDSGTVAFTARLDNGNAGVFTSSGGPITTILDDSDYVGPSPIGVAINNSGTVAFTVFLNSLAGPSPGPGVFTSNGGSITTITDESDSFADYFGGVAINDSGTVAFEANLDSGEAEGVFTGSGGPITTIDDESEQLSRFRAPAINNSGTVAFGTNPDYRGLFIGGIFTGSGGPLTTIVDTSGPFGGFSAPSINNEGTVAFSAIDDGGIQEGIFTSSGGVITPVVDTSGPFRFFEGPAINDNGTVAFLAALDDGGFGIFTGPDPIADKVIAIDDSFFGSTVTFLWLSGEGLNNRGLDNFGQIAFNARLADGTDGIYIATAVPEPSSVLGTLVFGAFGGGWMLKRKVKKQKLVSPVKSFD